MMTKEELAARLTGREYRKEMTKDEEAEAKAAGLVAIFGYSDDGVELRGAVHDEVGAWEGTTLYLHRGGLLESVQQIDCPRCVRVFKAAQKECVAIAVCWCPKPLPHSWLIKPDTDGSVPFAAFEIVEDGEPFCRGMVVALADLPALTVQL